MTLTSLLDDAIQALWPRRAQQEALLDLGERKTWTHADRRRQIEAVARWLIDNQVAPQRVAVAPASPMTLETARQHAASLGPSIGDRDAAVAIDLQQIAPLVGCATPKTLANSLSAWPRSSRPDHRWLQAIAVLTDAPTPPSGLCFDDRSTENLARLLGRTGGRMRAGCPDARDALVLFSLLALWQRRRPTAAVRANRGRPSTRRQAPKPMAGLSRDLIGARQFARLIDGAITHNQPAIAELAFEAALTAAHLGPHRARKTGDLDLRWLLPTACERVLELEALLGPRRAALWRHRVDIMISYRDRADRPEPPAEIARHPYVHMTTLLDRQRRGAAIDHAVLAQALRDDWLGKAMLAPIIHHRLETG